MALIRDYRALAFDDVLLVPKLNSISSRDEVDTSVQLGNIRLQIPIIAANMASVCGNEMASVMSSLGGLGIVHRMLSIREQANEVGLAFDRCFNLGHDKEVNIGAAIGVGEDAVERATACIEHGANVICIDVAHGHDLRVTEVLRGLFDIFDELTVIAGNIATRDAAQHIVDVCNKDERSRLVLKVGVGGGSVCTTRIQTGCGIPTFQSVIDTAHFGTIVADGGLKTSGDIVKALAAGSSAVMLGSLLSGTEETPGEPRLGPGGLVKPYRGSASSAAKKAFYGKAEYIEGEETTVPYKGDTSVVINSVLEGIRSGLTYCGSRTIEELWENAEFVKITAAGFAESKPHLLGR